MKVSFIVVCGLLLFVIGGCSSHHPKQVGATDWKTAGKKVVASSIEDFEKQAVRLCPFGYDILGEPQSFNQGEQNRRFIRCRMQR